MRENLSVDFFRKELLISMKNKDESKKEILQIIITDIRNKEIDSKKTLSESEIITIIQKEIKHLKETISLAGNRDTSIYKEQENYLESFLPEQLSDDEIMSVIKDNCEQTMNKGMIMKNIMPELRGKADNKRISDMVDTYLKGDFK
jgi:hypothetical protein